MRLSRVATYFDKTPCYDAYTGLLLFHAQFDLFDDSKRDGATVARRVLSLDPAIVLPARRVIQSLGEYWIIGDGFPDAFAGDAIRRKYVLHGAEHLVNVQTLGEKLQDVPGVTLWAARTWLKDSKEVDRSSQLTEVADVHISQTEVIATPAFVTFDNDTYLARTQHKGEAGTQVVLADRIESGDLVEVSWMSRTYVPTEGQYSQAETPVDALFIRFQSLFEYQSKSSIKFMPGDIEILVHEWSVTPKAGDKVVLEEETWTILSIIKVDEVWICHGRPA